MDIPTESRLTRLETRIDYIETIVSERKLVIESHARRMADMSNRVHDLTRIQSTNVERLTKLETLTDQTAATMHDDRQRKKHQRAMIQWAISVAMGIAVLVGVLTKGQQGVLTMILHGFSSPH